ncbi:sporulation-specific N-acetylmuramoyl-L-alanine amidase [Andreesenia angusta]|uniref:Sporulation-specific N-acetylmuramoyl-L-alanine amidase n=1 Tax=Andreesenia angusta TaxID=39480 RepID=A0A1S1V9T0_9FIRM|nr:N-acetylmuramoyl-L-alanine amidase [Andreesenia angusta]OHW62887.1 sporulation-specific N-acetylmuramoyl-L-alanine amidase [Andreesenia angusta]
MAKVWLDAGHGGHDPGAVGRRSLKEKDVALSVVLRIGEILKSHGVIVAYSRTDDRFIPLSERARMANNWGADIFVSEHCNSSHFLAEGIEAFAYPGSKEGAKLAREILDELKKINPVDRGVKFGDFAVLRETRMLAVLVEMGFISNIGDSAYLANEQQRLAELQATAILNHLNIKPNITGKDEIDMTKAELEKLLDDRDKALTSKVLREVTRLLNPGDVKDGHWVDLDFKELNEFLEANGVPPIVSTAHNNTCTRAEVIRINNLTRKAIESSVKKQDSK